MRKAVIYSAALHVMVVLIAYFGLPTEAEEQHLGVGASL